jgi:hypothetical protein
VLKAGEDLPLTPQPLLGFRALEAAAQELDRDLFLVLVVGTHGEVNRGHATLTDAANQPVVAERVPLPGLVTEKLADRGDRGLEEAPGFGVGPEQAFDLGAETGIVVALGIQECAPLLAGQRDSELEDLLDAALMIEVSFSTHLRRP